MRGGEEDNERHYEEMDNVSTFLFWKGRFEYSRGYWVVYLESRII